MLFYVLIVALFKVAVSVRPENCSGLILALSDEEFASPKIEILQNLHNLSSLTSNTEVWICSTEAILLDRTVIIENASNISINGWNGTRIYCPNETEAGFRLANIQGLVFSEITIENCAAIATVDADRKRNIRASVNIQFSSNVFISDINVLSGPGTGLALYNIDGTLDIRDSSFEGNGHDKTSGGNGLFLEVSVNSKVQSSPLVYQLVGCKFINNSAETGKDNKISGFTRFDKGGGICIFVRGHDGVQITVENSTISGNAASSYGGGVYLTFHNNARNSEYIVRGCNYTRNSARYGGGHYSGYLHNRYLAQTPLNCSYVFSSSRFVDNFAQYGGGISVFSTKTRISNPNGNISFESCTWENNSGQFGSAIAILPNAWNLHTDGYLPTFYISNCVLDSNKVIDYLDREGDLIRQFTKGSGALFCTHHTLQFNNFNSFNNNNGSAVYMGASIAKLSEHSETHFNFNSGYHGGAVYQTSSHMDFSQNVVLIFNGNTAYGRGGAVYHTAYDFHMYDYSRSCFFAYRNSIYKPKERNITVAFINNFAGSASNGYGHSIFSYSLLPCFRLFRFSINSVTSEIFDQLGNVTYYPPNREMEIATSASKSNASSRYDRVVSVLPGQEIQLPYDDTDDLGQEAKSVYLVTVQASYNSSINVDEAYTYISSSEVLLYGNTSDEALLLLSSYQSRQRSLTFRVAMLPCPPGYQLSSDNEQKSSQCACAHGTEGQYTGIENCHEATWTANRRRGYWIGYAGNETESEDLLVTGYCPMGFCSHSGDLLLPATANREDLNELICNSRAGILCGHCASNYSAYYHSLHFICETNNLCGYG